MFDIYSKNCCWYERTCNQVYMKALNLNTYSCHNLNLLVFQCMDFVLSYYSDNVFLSDNFPNSKLKKIYKKMF